MNFYSLGHSEGEREVVAALLGRQLRVVECVRIEVVDQCAEGQAVRPCRREVGYLNVLYGRGKRLELRSLHCIFQIQRLFAHTA